jgi:dTDP-4-amino-4,6-dideoxygalactose transaminase
VATREILSPAYNGVLMTINIMAPKLPTFASYKHYLEEIDHSGKYSNFGPLTKSLEARIADYLDIPPSCVISLANATLALEGAIQTSPGYKSSDWVIPSWTFSATAMAAERSGIKYRFGDIDHDWILQEKYQTSNHIEVLPFGSAPQSSSSRTTRIVDAAASFDAICGIGGSKIGNSGFVVSLHATKILPAGEGAFFFANNPLWVEKIRNWANFGFDQNRNSVTVGTNAKMSEYAAAIALASLDEWTEVRAEWKYQNEIALRISEKLDIEVHSAMKKGLASPYWIIDLKDAGLKHNAVKFLTAGGVETRDWWKSGCHSMPFFTHIGTDGLEMTDKVASTTLGLPMHRNMSLEDFEVIEKILVEVTQ